VIVCGVDPGLSGALAFYDVENGDLEVLDMPTLKAGTGGKRIVDIDALATAISSRADYVSHAFIEQVGTRPGEGAVGAFSFGEGFGALKGVVVANLIPRTFVRPNVWKKALGVPAEKDGARSRASQLLPRHAHYWARVKDDGRAESALIALYGARQLGR
jgi:crossover junction endodeoxyribonuclease RuvC